MQSWVGSHSVVFPILFLLTNTFSSPTLTLLEYSGARGLFSYALSAHFDIKSEKQVKLITTSRSELK